jgi:hypothetical protein
MHTALIFKEQAKVKETGIREKGLAQPHYSIQHIEGYVLGYVAVDYKPILSILFNTDVPEADSLDENA